MNVKKALRHILTVIREQNIPLFCNHDGQPYIELPLDPQKRAWPLRSEPVRAWISTECYRGLDFVLSSGAIQTIVTVLEGHAWDNVRSVMEDGDLALSVERDPVLQVILEFMASRRQHRALMTSLVAELTALAKRKGLVGMGKGKWPGSSWVFSHRLKSNSLILQRLGISVSIRYTEQGFEVILEKLQSTNDGDAGGVTASPAPPSPTPLPANDFERSDASPCEDADVNLVEEINRRKGTS